MNRYWKRMMKYRPGLYMTLTGRANSSAYSSLKTINKEQKRKEK